MMRASTVTDVPIGSKSAISLKYLVKSFFNGRSANSSMRSYLLKNVKKRRLALKQKLKKKKLGKKLKLGLEDLDAKVEKARNKAKKMKDQGIALLPEQQQAGAKKQLKNLQKKVYDGDFSSENLTNSNGMKKYGARKVYEKVKENSEEQNSEESGQLADDEASHEDKNSETDEESESEEEHPKKKSPIKKQKRDSNDDIKSQLEELKKIIEEQNKKIQKQEDAFAKVMPKTPQNSNLIVGDNIDQSTKGSEKNHKISNHMYWDESGQNHRKKPNKEESQSEESGSSEENSSSEDDHYRKRQRDYSSTSESESTSDSESSDEESHYGFAPLYADTGNVPLSGHGNLFMGGGTPFTDGGLSPMSSSNPFTNNSSTPMSNHFMNSNSLPPYNPFINSDHQLSPINTNHPLGPTNHFLGSTHRSKKRKYLAAGSSTESDSTETGYKPKTKSPSASRGLKMRKKKWNKAMEKYKKKTRRYPTEKLPGRQDIFFIDDKTAAEKKSYGPFSDDKKNPFYYPGVHDLAKEEGKHMLNDQFRFHPQFLAQMAENGGFYRRKIHNSPDGEGPHIIEEQFGFTPRKDNQEETSSSSETDNSDSSKESNSKSKRFMNSSYDPNFGRKTDIEALRYQLFKRLQQMQDENEQTHKSHEDRHKKLHDVFLRTADQLDQNIHQGVIGGIRSKIGELDTAVQSTKDRAFTKEEIKKSKKKSPFDFMKLHPAMSLLSS